MNKYRRALAGVAAATLLTAGLAACSSTPASTKTVTLNFESLAWQKESIAANKAIVTQWNKDHPDIQVKYVQGDWSSIGDQLTAAFQAGKAPDVFQYYDAGLEQYAKGGDLLDLKKTLSSSFVSDILPGAWKTVQFSGTPGTWGVPFLQEPQLIYANKTLLDKAGVTLPTIDKPWTWQEFADAAKKLTGGGVYGAAMALKDGGVDDLMAMSPSFDAQYFSADGTSVRWTSAEAALPTRIDSMLNDDHSMSPSSLGFDHSTILPSFLDGKAAMIFGGTYLRQQIEQGKKSGFDWVALPPPVGVNQHQGNASQTISIAAQTKYPKQATRFLEYLLNPTNQVKLAAGDWETPTSIQAGRNAKFTSATLGWNVAIAQSKQLVEARFQTVSGYGEWASKVAYQAFGAYYAGKITIDQLKQQLIDQGDPVLAKAAAQ